MFADITAPAKPVNYDGKNIADALSDLARHAGPYDISMEYGGEKPTLSVVRTKYKYGDSAITINRADTDHNIADPKIVVAGDLSEDVDQFYSKVTMAGALVFVERRVSSVSSSGLIPAWSEETSGSGVAFVNDRLSSGDTLADAMAKAFSRFPDWYGAWRLNPDFDFTDGIASLSGFDFARVGRPVADRVLTSYIGGSNADDADPSDRAQWRRRLCLSIAPAAASRLYSPARVTGCRSTTTERSEYMACATSPRLATRRKRTSHPVRPH